MKITEEHFVHLLLSPDVFPIPDTIIDLIDSVANIAAAVTAENLPVVYTYIQRLPIVQQASFWTLVTRRNEGDLTYSKELKHWLQLNNRSFFEKKP